MASIVDVNTECMVVHVQAGMLGPALEESLGRRDLTCAPAALTVHAAAHLTLLCFVSSQTSPLPPKL